MLTSSEIAVIGNLLMLRASEHGRELWAAVNDDHALEAERLAQRGYLTRRWDRERDDLVYRATDVAAAAQTLHNAAVATASTMSDN
jgi:hypothetical protein